jgi:hypothetical protein
MEDDQRVTEGVFASAAAPTTPWIALAPTEQRWPRDRTHGDPRVPIDLGGPMCPRHRSEAGRSAVTLTMGPMRPQGAKMGIAHC